MGWWPGYIDEEDDLELDSFELSDGNIPESQVHWKEALEENKTRDRCILCGSKTVDKPIFTSVIKFCPCVDEKAREDK